MRIHDLTNEDTGEYVLYLNGKELMRSPNLAELELLKRQFPNYKIDINPRQKKLDNINYVLYIDGEAQAYSKNKDEFNDFLEHIKQKTPDANIEIKLEPVR